MTGIPLPTDPGDSVGMTILLREDANDAWKRIYGTDPYIIAKSYTNQDLPGITEEELLRIIPSSEYNKPGARAHALLFGQGMYARLRERFVQIY